MKIGKERRPERIQSRNWLKFFEEAEVGKALAVRRLKDLVGRTLKTVEEEKSDSSEVNKVVDLIIGNCRRLQELDF